MREIILVPGLLCDAFVWAPLQQAIGGRGHVPDLSRRDNLTDMAEDALAMAADSSPLAVAGFSMGGRIAMEMARLAPGRVEKLALLDTGMHPLREGERAKRDAVVQKAYDEGMAPLAEEWLRGMVHAPNRENAALMAGLREMVTGKTPELHARQIKALVDRPDAEAYIGEIAAETLLIVGAHDAWAPPARHEAMLKRLRNARLEVIPDAGHFALVEKPESVTPLLAEFLTG